MRSHKQTHLSKTMRKNLFNNAAAAYAATNATAYAATNATADAAYAAATNAAAAAAAAYAATNAAAAYTAAHAAAAYTAANYSSYYFWRNEVFKHLPLILCQIAIRDEIMKVVLR